MNGHKLKSLKMRQKQLLVESMELASKLHKVKQAICFEEYGVRVGSIIKNLLNGDDYKVSRLEVNNCAKPSLYYKIPEKQLRCTGYHHKPVLFEWKVVKP